MSLKYAAIFVRKSDRDDQGIQDQTDLCVSAAVRDGYHVPEQSLFRYSENAISGAAARRPELERLTKLVESGNAPFSRVYMKARDRLGRFTDTNEHAYYLVRFKMFGVQILFLNEPEVDHDQPGALVVGAVLGSLNSAQAAAERDRLIRRVTTGMRSKVKAGSYPGSRAPYGYDRWLVDTTTNQRMERSSRGRSARLANCLHQLFPADDGTASIVRTIFEAAAKGKSAWAIAKTLNAAAEPSPASRGVPGKPQAWNSATVLRMLRNPIYVGILEWGRTTRSEEGPAVSIATADLEKEEHAVRNEKFLSDPLISRDLWEEVQRLLSGRQGSPAGRRASNPAFVLSSLLRCAVCNRRFEGATSGASRRKSYRHSSRGADNHPCLTDARYLPGNELEQAVEGVVTTWLETGAHVQPLKDALRLLITSNASPDREAELQTLRAQIAAADEAAMNAGRLATETSHPAAAKTYSAIVVEASDRSSRLTERMQRLASASTVAAEALHRLDEGSTVSLEPAVLYRSASPAERKRLLSGLFTGILVHPDELTLELILRDPTRPTSQA
jgi:DNA invertase Pin-like site-specific DNA recombinase